MTKNLSAARAVTTQAHQKRIHAISPVHAASLVERSRPLSLPYLIFRVLFAVPRLRTGLHLSIPAYFLLFFISNSVVIIFYFIIYRVYRFLYRFFYSPLFSLIDPVDS